MKITKIKKTISATINIGNYENIHPELTIEANIDSDESYSAASSEIDRVLLSEFKKDVLKHLSYFNNIRSKSNYIQDNKIPMLIEAYK